MSYNDPFDPFMNYYNAPFEPAIDYNAPVEPAMDYNAPFEPAMDYNEPAMNYNEPAMRYNDPLDPALIISKVLRKSDIACSMALPKAQVVSVLTKMNDVTHQNLQNGVEVQVHDIMEGDLYTVTLKLACDKTKYYFGDGWSTIKHSMDLNEGDVLKLYWDHLDQKFIVLNFQYSVLQAMIPV